MWTRPYIADFSGVGVVGHSESGKRHGKGTVYRQGGCRSGGGVRSTYIIKTTGGHQNYGGRVTGWHVPGRFPTALPVEIGASPQQLSNAMSLNPSSRNTAPRLNTLHYSQRGVVSYMSEAPDGPFE